MYYPYLKRLIKNFISIELKLIIFIPHFHLVISLIKVLKAYYVLKHAFFSQKKETTLLMQ